MFELMSGFNGDEGRKDSVIAGRAGEDLLWYMILRFLGFFTVFIHRIKDAFKLSKSSGSKTF